MGFENMSYVGNFSINKKRYEVLEESEKELYEIYVRNFDRNEVQVVYIEKDLINDDTSVLSDLKSLVIQKVKNSGVEISYSNIVDKTYPIDVWNELVNQFGL